MRRRVFETARRCFTQHRSTEHRIRIDPGLAEHLADFRISDASRANRDSAATTFIDPARNEVRVFQVDCLGIGVETVGIAKEPATFRSTDLHWIWISFVACPVYDFSGVQTGPKRKAVPGSENVTVLDRVSIWFRPHPTPSAKSRSTKMFEVLYLLPG